MKKISCRNQKDVGDVWMKLLANKLQGMEYYWPADKVHKQEPQHKYIALFHTTIPTYVAVAWQMHDTLFYCYM